MMIGLVGQNLGKYQILEEIGRGGMGAVYKGYDPVLERHVAVKVLAPYLVWEREFLERFFREARAAARLSHPNIVTIHDVGEEGGWYYFVMEYLEGENIKTLVQRRGVLPLEEVLPILQGLASGLDYAHRQGLVHRDVKPSNVIVGPEGRVTLTDFGVVKAAYEAKLTSTGTTLGTPEYMAPEQVMGKGIGPWTDLYALGVIAYELLAGVPPFAADATPAILHQHVYEPVPPIRERRPDLPAALEEVLERALAKAPEERYRSGAALVEALAQLLPQEESPFLQQQRRLREAEALEQAGKWAEAAEVYGELVQQAQTSEQQEDWTAAQARCQEEAELADLFDRGEAELNAERWSEARQALADLLRRQPEYVRRNQPAAALLAQAMAAQEETVVLSWGEARPVAPAVGVGPPAGEAPTAQMPGGWPAVPVAQDRVAAPAQAVVIPAQPAAAAVAETRPRMWRRGLALLGWWCLATALGWIVGDAIAGANFLRFGLRVFAAGVLGGSAAGLGQWLILRHRLRRAGWWILASAIGGAVVGFYGYGLLRGPERLFFSWPMPLGCGIVGGTVAGLGQWLVLRRGLRRASWWILTSAVGWVLIARSERYLGYLWLGNLSGQARWAREISLAGLVMGLITGLALLLLLARNEELSATVWVEIHPQAGKRDWHTLGWWSLTTMWSWVVPSFAPLILGREVPFYRGYLYYHEDPSLLFYLAAGALAGLGQWLLLRGWLRRAGWWILSSAIGWTLASVAFSLWEYESWQILGMNAIVGAVVGLGQWLLLRGWLRRAGWWILASAVGFSVTMAMIGHVWFLGLVADIWGWGGWAIIGLLSGLIPGLALVFLLAHPQADRELP